MRAAIVTIGCAVLGACAVLPPQPAQEIPAVDETAILRAVRCELRKAAVGSRRDVIDKYDFGVELDLKLIYGSNAQASAVLVLPQAPETVSGSMGFGLTGRSTRRSYKMVQFTGGSLKSQDCGEKPVPTGLPTAIENLGATEWAENTFSAIPKGTGAELKNAYYWLEFVLAANANGGISVIAYRVTGASVGAGLSRETTHVLKIAATRREKPPAEKPLAVVITGWPATPPATPPAMSGEKARPSQGLRPFPRRSDSGGGDGGVSPQSSEQLQDLLSRDRPLRLETR